MTQDQHPDHIYPKTLHEFHHLSNHHSNLRRPQKQPLYQGHQKPLNKLGCQPPQDLILVIQMVAALAPLKVTPTMGQGKQVAEAEDLRAWDQLLPLCWEEASTKLQNLRKIMEVVNGRMQLFLIIVLMILWIF